MYMCTHTCVFVYVYVPVPVCVCVCVYMCVSVLVYMCMCACRGGGGTVWDFVCGLRHIKGPVSVLLWICTHGPGSKSCQCRSYNSRVHRSVQDRSCCQVVQPPSHLRLFVYTGRNGDSSSPVVACPTAMYYIACRFAPTCQQCLTFH